MRFLGVLLRIVRRRPLLALLTLLLVAFGALNALAWWHARALTTFVEARGAATARPEELTGWGRVRVALTGVHIPRPRNDHDPGLLGMPFEVHRARTVDGEELELWRVPHGSPRARVVMVPGYASAKGSLLPEARALFDLGCEPWLVDLRGTGGSSGSRTSLGWFEALDVAAASAVARDDAPLLVFGQSMGAAAALRAVHEGWLEPDGMILEAPYDELGRTVRARFEAMGLPSWPAANLLLFWGGVQLGYAPADNTPWRWAESVECPTLHLAGASDPRVPPAVSRRVHAGLRGAKTLVFFERVGHVSLFRARPKAWRAAVSSFLDGIQE